MAGFKKINPANPTAKRPLRVEDLADLWEAIVASVTAPNEDGSIRIVSGFFWTTESSTEFELSAGTLSYNGKLYYYDGTEGIKRADRDSQYMYIGEVADDTRTLSDGSQIPFSFKRIVTKTPFEGGERFGPLTDDNLFIWGRTPLKAEQVTNTQIAPNTITYDRIKLGTIASFNLSANLQPVGRWVDTWITASSPDDTLNSRIVNDGTRWSVPIYHFVIQAASDTDFGTINIEYDNSNQQPLEIIVPMFFQTLSQGGRYDLAINYSIVRAGVNANSSKVLHNRKLTINAPCDQGCGVLVTFNKIANRYVPTNIKVMEGSAGEVTWADEFVSDNPIVIG